jgi:hypothetical protein
MNANVTFPLAALAIAIAAGTSLPASAETSALDGKTFEGVFLERGKTRGDADTLIFKDGHFRSTACDRYGYGDAAYKAIPEGDAVRFEAETTSAKYGPLKWKGWVRGEKLDATAVLAQDGKAPVENWVAAGLKR